MRLRLRSSRLRCELSETLKRHKPLGFSEILKGVDVEEGIDRLSRPADRRDAITPGPTLNLTEPLHQKGLAQCVAQRDLPQSDHRMRSSLRGGDGKLRALSGHGLLQSYDQVSRQERAISGGAKNPLCVGPVGRGPVEPGEDSGERSGMLFHPIGNDRQTERRKARGIAVGAENQAFALRLDPRNDAGQNPVPSNFAQRLVAATHSTRQTAREHHPRHAESFSHHSRLLACGEPARKALTPIGASDQK
jgi:hypothetical protein